MKNLNVMALFIFSFIKVFSCVVLLASEEIPVIIIKDHHFSPEELKIPSGKKVKILVKNEDPFPEEFESYDLKREKVVTAGGEITLFVGPLKAGVYKYFGDFHPQTAQGRIIAEENS